MNYVAVDTGAFYKLTSGGINNVISRFKFHFMLPFASYAELQAGSLKGRTLNQQPHSDAKFFERYLTNLDKFIVIDCNAAIVEAYITIQATAMILNRKLGQNDAWIIACAKVYDIPLITTEKSGKLFTKHGVCLFNEHFKVIYDGYS